MIYVLIPTTPERRERLESCILAVRKSVCTEPITICVYENNDGGWVKATHNLIHGIDSHAVVFLINDDMIIQPDCIQKLWEKFVETEMEGVDLPWLLQPYDQFQEGRICTAPFCRAKVLSRYLYKGYVHNFSDNELTEVVRKQGRYLYVPEARIEHQHFLDDQTRYDETYDRTQRFMAQDKALFEQRQLANFEPKN